MPTSDSVDPLPSGKQPRNPLSRKQVERVISRSVAVFGIVFGAQTVPWLLGQIDEAYPLWLLIVVPALFGILVLALVLAILQVRVRQAQGVFAIVYLAALISWPFTVMPSADIFPGIHWLYYLMSVGTGMAAIGFSTAWATVYLLVAPAVYLVVRSTPLGGGAPLQLATLEAVYSVILGAAIIIIVTMLRQASSSVDAAQATALDRYGHAVRQHATEVERVQVDSIVHDSVLTTFISAARAFTPQAMALASTMAGNAIGYLRDAAAVDPSNDPPVTLKALAARISRTASDLSRDFAVLIVRPGQGQLPAAAGEAIYSASVQAMVNSLQHAGEEGVSRWVSVTGIGDSGIQVVVGDDGRGFDRADVPDERLGVRVSVLERVSSAGGRATIVSSLGQGTEVTVRWPHGGESVLTTGPLTLGAIRPPDALGAPNPIARSAS